MNNLQIYSLFKFKFKFILLTSFKMADTLSAAVLDITNNLD